MSDLLAQHGMEPVGDGSIVPVAPTTTAVSAYKCQIIVVFFGDDV